MIYKYILVCLIFIVSGRSPSSSCDKSLDFSQWHNCKGTYVLQGKGTYTGEWKHGLEHGEGRFELINGSIYIGDFEQGKLSGKGVMTSPDFRYEGEFKNNQYNGFGFVKYSYGAEYRGQFLNNRFHGNGVYEDAEGIYTGAFREGSMHGKGVFVSSRLSRSGKNIIYRGTFINGKLDGEGEVDFGHRKMRVQFKNGKILGLDP